MRIFDTTIFVSPSSFTSRMECSEAHALRYRDGVEGLPSLNFSRGKALHAGLEGYFLSRLAEPEQDPAAPELVDHAVEMAMINLAEEHEAAKEIPFCDFDQEDLNLWYGVIAKGIPQYITEIGQYLEPVKVEEKIEAKIGTIGGRDVILFGYADLIATASQDVGEDIKDGGFFIIDYKTGKRAGASVQNKIQLLCYQIILSENGRKASTQIHKFIAKGPTKKEPDRAECQISVEPMRYNPEQDKAEWLEELILGHVADYLRGARAPCGITGFGCGGCSVRNNCKYYEGIEL